MFAGARGQLQRALPLPLAGLAATSLTFPQRRPRASTPEPGSVWGLAARPSRGHLPRRRLNAMVAGGGDAKGRHNNRAGVENAGAKNAPEEEEETFDKERARDVVEGLERVIEEASAIRLAAEEMEQGEEGIRQLPGDGRPSLVQEAEHATAPLRKRASRDLALARRVLAGEVPLTARRHQGMRNNLQGMEAELSTALQAPGVIAVGRNFYSNPVVGAAGSGGKRKGGGLAVEVDVVAQWGHTWVEVKDQRTFHTSSGRWAGGSGGHSKGLQQQAAEYLEVAARPCNRMRWRAPAVVFRFVGGVDTDVASELRGMGVWVLEDDGVMDCSKLPPPPPLPSRVNLDVTALCALVSEVSNGGIDTPEVAAFVAAHSQWADCVRAELESPILPGLEGILNGRELWASPAAVERFESIVGTVGGARERARWEALRGRVKSGDPPPPPGGRADWEAAGKFWSPRVEALPGLSSFQKEVLGWGDAAGALTLTANGRAVRSAKTNGVTLEAYLHRPVWLAGA